LVSLILVATGSKAISLSFNALWLSRSLEQTEMLSSLLESSVKSMESSSPVFLSRMFCFLFATFKAAVLILLYFVILILPSSNETSFVSILESIVTF